MKLDLTKLSSQPIEGISYKSNLSNYRGSVYGGRTYGVFEGFHNLTNWLYEYKPTENTLKVWKEADPSEIHTVSRDLSNISELSFTFDKQMLPVYTYVRDKETFIYFFDSSITDYTHLKIPEAATPKVALSSVHFSHAGDSQVVLGYVRDNRNLCVRLQSERYAQEHVVKEFDNDIKLYNIGFTTANRFQYDVLEIQA